MGGLDLVDVALIAGLVGLWAYILWTARGIAARSFGEPPRPRRPVKGLTLAGMVLWFVSSSVPDAGTRALLFYGGWACVFVDAAWYLWALKRLDPRTSRNLD